MKTQKKHCPIISFINEKGGVGKTTTAVNVAHILSKTNRVLLIDLDPSSNATTCLGFEVSRFDVTSYDMFLTSDFSVDYISKNQRRHGIYFIPGTDKLSGLNMTLTSVTAREKVLKKKILEYKLTEKFDYIFIDCQGSFSLLNVNAIVASTDIIMVMQTEHLSLEGIPKTMKTINTILSALDENPNILGVLPTMYDSRLKTHKSTLEKLKNSSFKDKVFKNTISNNVDLARSNEYRIPILEMKPNAKSATEYKNFTKEMIGILDEKN